MFQNYEIEGGSQHSGERIAALRTELRRRGLNGFLVPRTDEFQGEYVAAYAERLRWLTGFSGSAGIAAILEDRAAIFVDGRYTIQVREQVDLDQIAPLHLIETPLAGWLEGEVQSGWVIGYDPWLMTAAEVDKLRAACSKAGAELLAVDSNPVDAVWSDQPQRPDEPINLHPLEFAGRSAKDKIADVCKELDKRGADAVVLTMPDSVAWVFNIRGADISHTPVALCYALIGGDGGAQLFIDRSRVPQDVAAALDGLVEFVPPDGFEPALEALGDRGASVSVDPATAPDRVRTLVTGQGGKVVEGRDPCILPKACKNEAELDGTRAAHRRDGAAMVRFLAWFSREASSGELDEITVAQKLEEFRRATNALEDISFDTISAAGPHAAIPHYKVNTASNRAISAGEIYLIDSGGQYRDGTTDITRTVAVGEANAEMRDRFTRVLKGMINLSRVRFPAGTTGGNLDVLARQGLWDVGLDFDHGTGHGVGSFLSVHEGPARFSKIDATKLQTGMILSNEPGYYKEGNFGIRIENLVAVREPQEVSGGERAMHWLETLTLCPIDRALIAPDLLADDELQWLNDYHARVRKDLGRLVDGNDLDWLEVATAPIGRG